MTYAIFPPWSVLVGYWMFGAFLMDIKRYAELRFISDKETAAQYRKSFKFYTEKNLLVWAVFYALCSGFFLAVFMIKHRIELLLILPFIAILYSWYLSIGMKDESPARNPESIPRYEKGFMTYLILFIVLVTALMIIDIPVLHWFQEPAEQFNLKTILGLE